MRLAVLACVLALAGTAATVAVAQPDVRPVEPFFAASPRTAGVVLRNHPGGQALATLSARTEFGSPETVGVAATRGAWVGVISTTLPNGVVGWVPRRELNLRPVDWSIEISLSSRVLVLRHGGEVVRRVTVGIGASSSPTPVGRYVVTDHIDPGAQASVYGCCILALSGHQPHPPAGWSANRDWRLAIHGGATGAVSAGCIHADTATLRYLMRRTPLGTPVTVTA
jgi:lipoprotein-anchoring transpeptidase ErfK/SrfK